MVGARTISASLSSPPQPGRDSSASFRFFGACMQGWYHRCIGLDP
jgi:hypothetical protein